MTRLTKMILILTTFFTVAKGQNLVPNPTFEDTLYCPVNVGAVSVLSGWKSFGATVDALHSCSSTSQLHLPNSDFGYQYPHSGEAMIGVVTYIWQYSTNWPYYQREYAGAKLMDTLQIGQKYYLSFFMNYSGHMKGFQKIASNKMGMKFTTFEFDSITPPLPDNSAHLYTDSIVTDTVQWFKVFGSFIADSAYTYVVLGNFFDTLQTDTVIFDGDPNLDAAAYYFLDDICVSTDSIYASTWTGIKESNNLTSLKCYPNPSSKNITISFDNSRKEDCTLKIYAVNGQLVRSITAITSDKIEVERQNLTNGLYFYQLHNDRRIIGSGKFIFTN